MLLTPQLSFCHKKSRIISSLEIVNLKNDLNYNKYFKPLEERTRLADSICATAGFEKSEFIGYENEYIKYMKKQKKTSFSAFPFNRNCIPARMSKKL